MPVGRIIFTLNALPAVRLTNFTVASELIVLRTAAGTTLARRLDGTIVMLEADFLDAATSSGWSVTVTGRAALVTDPATAARLNALPLVPWAPGPPDQFMTISAELVEGVRVPRRGQAEASPGSQHRRAPGDG